MSKPANNTASPASPAKIDVAVTCQAIAANHAEYCKEVASIREAAKSAERAQRGGQLFDLYVAFKDLPKITVEIWAETWQQPMLASLIASGVYTEGAAKVQCNMIKAAAVAITHGIAPSHEETETGEVTSVTESLRDFASDVKDELATLGLWKAQGGRKAKDADPFLDAANVLCADKDTAKLLAMIAKEKPTTLRAMLLQVVRDDTQGSTGVAKPAPTMVHTRKRAA